MTITQDKTGEYSCSEIDKIDMVYSLFECSTPDMVCESLSKTFAKQEHVSLPYTKYINNMLLNWRLFL